MPRIRSILRSRTFIETALLVLVSGTLYLIFISQFGYFNDDWYLMYAAGAKGPAVFWDIFSIDRPLRALVMIPAYTLFGANPLYYNLSAFLFRLIAGFSFLWILRMLWPDKNRMTLWMALLFLIYPGFLSQPNAIDYLCHLAGLAAGMLSIGLTIQAVQAGSWIRKILFYVVSILLGWFYLGQIEWYIGLEFFRFACMGLLVLRLKETPWGKAVRFFQQSLPAFLIPGVFLAWRLFFFESERGATDVDLQLGDLRAQPVAFLFNYLSVLLNDLLDVLIQAWWLPLRRLSGAMTTWEWMPGFGIALFVLVLLWVASGLIQRPAEVESGDGPAWRREVIWVGLGVLVFGLLPVILVGRSVDFKSFSRYTLIASVGAALLWPLALSYVHNPRLRNALFGILILSASLTHYVNGLARVRETESMNRFWWQVSWRIPQIEQGTTLIANYPAITIEEDYFVWGPASLIYYPDSLQVDYPQPGVYALLMNADTIEKVLAREPQEFSNRRSIRTYPNYRNILILTQPTLDSCVQVIDGLQPEFSTSEDERFMQIGSFSEIEHVLTQEPFHKPPLIPFGEEPAHDWCFYYQKLAFARQVGDWDQAARLAEEAVGMGLHPQDEIEWMPFLQAYAAVADLARLAELDSRITDPLVRQQACQILSDMRGITAGVRLEAQTLFCPR